jgi:hypothetical protein
MNATQVQALAGGFTIFQLCPFPSTLRNVKVFVVFFIFTLALPSTLDMLSPEENLQEIATPGEQDGPLAPQPCPEPRRQCVSLMDSATIDSMNTPGERSSSCPDAVQPVNSTPTAMPQPGSQASSPDAAAPTELSLSSFTTSIHSPALEDVTYGSIELLSPWFPRIDPANKRAKTF